MIYGDVLIDYTYIIKTVNIKKKLYNYVQGIFFLKLTSTRPVYEKNKIKIKWMFKMKCQLKYMSNMIHTIIRW